MATIVSIKSGASFTIGVFADAGERGKVIDLSRRGFRAVGLAGTGSLGQAINYHFVPPLIEQDSKMSAFDYLAGVFVPALFDFIHSHGSLSVAELFPQLDLLIQVNGSLYHLRGGNEVIEVQSDGYSIGEHSEYCRGFIEGTDLDPNEILCHLQKSLTAGEPLDLERLQLLDFCYTESDCTSGTGQFGR